MSEPKCVCSMGCENSCRVHNEKSKAAYEWADSYFRDNVDVLGLELFHREMLEVAHKAGQSDYDELTRQNKILRDQRNYQIKQNTDSAEQYARLVAHEDEALKSCGGGGGYERHKWS